MKLNLRIGIAVALALLSRAAVGQDKPADRVPWAASRLTGSPEPPLPLRSERVFPNLNFRAPVQLVPFPDRRRWVLVEEKGMIYSFPNDPAVEKADLLIDLRKEIRGVDKLEGVRGVGSTYSLAFDPDFSRNRTCYVMYWLASKDRRKLDNGTRVSRFKVTEADPPRIDPASEEILITWVAGGHNGCDLQFGNDGYLYISAGDAEDPSPPDKLRTGQDIGDLMSSILRIDVHKASDGKPYAIPSDNPFIGVPKARPEVWCYGLRNPWRMSFDRATGRLWIGDVGWERWEMIIAAEKGGN
jgi:glucose/arabinose dehydrogenase